MGDRGNIKLVGKDNFPNPAYLYTHWRGCDMKDILRDALVKGKSRWDDGQYLSRVIFQTLIGDDDDVTGFGLSTSPGDNEHPFLVVNVDEQLVWEEPYKHSILSDDSIATPMSFAEFVEKVKV